MTGSSSRLEDHVDVHRGERATYAPAFRPLQQTQFSQRHHVIVHALDVAPQFARQFPHRKVSLALTGSDNGPMRLGELTEELARAFKIRFFRTICG